VQQPTFEITRTAKNVVIIAGYGDSGQCGAGLTGQICANISKQRETLLMPHCEHEMAPPWCDGDPLNENVANSASLHPPVEPVGLVV